MEDEYVDFVEKCLDSDNLDGICSFKDFEKMTDNLNKDGFY